MLSFSELMKAAVKRPAWLLLPLFESGFFKGMDDEKYLKLEYKAMTGQKLRLGPPRTFNEKIAWLKLHDRKPLYRLLADKYGAREFVASWIGEEWLVPLLGIWERAEDIDFSALPERFVLKCTHGYGGTVICRDKAKLDEAAARAKLAKTLRSDFFTRGREWVYKDALPRIVAEAFVDDGGARPADYKFMCFNGKVGAVCVSRGLGDFATGALSFYWPDGTRAPFKRRDYPGYPDERPMPENFFAMKEAAERLAAAADAPFVRADFYEAAGKAYFSELTFYPCGGTMFLDPPEYDRTLGDMLELPV